MQRRIECDENDFFIETKNIIILILATMSVTGR